MVDLAEANGFRAFQDSSSRLQLVAHVRSKLHVISQTMSHMLLTPEICHAPAVEPATIAIHAYEAAVPVWPPM